MAEVIFTGPEGRLEGRFHAGPGEAPPLALILHPNPAQRGTMNNTIAHTMFKVYQARGFSVLRFNFRGVGRSQGVYDHGEGELSDAAAALDWMQSHNPNATECWVAGFSFGAWIGMQVLMRRPEITGFTCVAPPANTHDFSFLAPCPSSGLIVHGLNDELVPEPSVAKLVAKLRAQRGIEIDYEIIPDTDHFFRGKEDTITELVGGYLDKSRSPA